MVALFQLSLQFCSHLIVIKPIGTCKLQRQLGQICDDVSGAFDHFRDVGTRERYFRRRKVVPNYCSGRLVRGVGVYKKTWTMLSENRVLERKCSLSVYDKCDDKFVEVLEHRGTKRGG